VAAIRQKASRLGSGRPNGPARERSINDVRCIDNPFVNSRCAANRCCEYIDADVGALAAG
jgi:hypothetical protein